MKKKGILLIGFASLLTISCEKPTENTVNDDMPYFGVGNFNGVAYGENIDLDDPTGRVTEFTISSDLAMIIGDAILYNHFGKDATAKMTLHGEEIAEKGYYVISRLSDGGGGYSVAINKEDGKILRIWTEE
jgi:hypothetical protein